MLKTQDSALDGVDTSDTGRLLIVAGLGIALVGVFLALGGRAPALGHLPGDLVFQRDGASVYIPLGTMVVVSPVLTVVLNVLGRFFR